MKVYIGPYVNWIGPYQITDFVFKWWLGEERADSIAKWLCTKTPLEKWLQAVHNKRKRKVKVKLHPYDSWNADDTLAHIILPVLKAVKESKHGVPMVADKDVPVAIRSTTKDTRTDEEKDAGNTDPNFVARWNYVLDEMIFAFSSIVEGGDWSDFTSGNIDWVPIGFDASGNRTDDKDSIAWYSYEEGPNHTYKVDQKAMDAWEKRRANGFRLFGKYYLALWT